MTEQEMKRRIYDLESENETLQSIIDGSYPSRIWWMMTKIDRQRRMLDTLQKKGKGHTKEEREELASAS